MKPMTLITLALAAALAAAPAAARDSEPRQSPSKAAAPEREAPEKEAHAPSAQQNRMKACNAEAGKKNLKGDERRAFMSHCLKG